LRPAGYAAGLALLVAAVVMVWRQRESVSAAWEAVDRPSILMLLALAGTVLLSISLTSFVLRFLLLRYGRVGVVEMHALIAAASLLNFLPMRPGLIGRVAYHKAVNGIRAVDTARTVVQALAISGAVVAYLALAAVVCMWRGWSLWPAVLIPLPMIAGAALVGPLRPWMLASLLRYLEVLSWGMRYFLAFALLGSPIEPTGALALACAGVIATFIPFFGNGLGLREWAIGLLAPLLTDHQLELGITADLVNRAMEIVIFCGTGLAGMAWLAANRRGEPRSPQRQSRHPSG
jgi:hypothetical protein